MNTMKRTAKKLLHVFLYLFVLLSFALCLGCDSGNDSGQATPTPTLQAPGTHNRNSDDGETPNPAETAPTTPTPNVKPTPSPTPVPTPKPVPAAVPTPHEHTYVEKLVQRNYEVIIYECDDCDFSTNDEVKAIEHCNNNSQPAHTYVETKGSYYTCSHCSGLFFTDYDVQLHFDDHPPHETEWDGTIGKYTCDNCNQDTVFDTEETAKAHESANPGRVPTYHVNGTYYACEYCGFVTASKAEMDAHVAGSAVSHSYSQQVTKETRWVGSGYWYCSECGGY